MVLDSLQSILVFVHVAETRNFTTAARRLGISPSGVSKALGRLETKLGVRLVARTTRAVRVTDEGLALLQACRPIVSNVEEAEAVLTRRMDKPSGRVRVQMPPNFGRQIVVPVVGEFTSLYPDLVVDIELSDRVSDLIEEGLDAVVRIGDPIDNRLIARKICEIRYVTVAAPSYLKRNGEPKVPADLKKHHCLGYFFPHTSRYREWHFSNSKEPKVASLSGQINVNNGLVLMEAALSGIGIASIASFLAFDAINSGRLKVVLPGYAGSGSDVWLLYSERRYQSPRVRALISHLTDRIPRLPWLK
jgi:DNA-binding transcriptional LysR family regulator